MQWGLGFRLRQYWLSSLWLIPAIFAAAAALAARAMIEFDQRHVEHQAFEYSAETAISILSALLSASITFTGLVVTMLLLVPQFASAQLSARVLQLIYRDPRLKLVFGSFLAAIVYSFMLLIRVRGDFVPGVSLWLAGILVLINVLSFLGFVSYFVQRLRPATAAARIAEQGIAVIEAMFPDIDANDDKDVPPVIPLAPGAPSQVIRRTGAGGVVLAIGLRGLERIAEHEDCVIVVRLSAGEYVSAGATIFEISGAKRTIPDAKLLHLIALGKQRTFEQDPLFAFRILVDIAAKALSPAINDPTTATIVIDRLEDLLVLLSHRKLGTGVMRDSAGKVRVIYPTPTWHHYLLLAVTEIRLYGHGSIQVAARLNTMLRSLLEVVPAPYVTMVNDELGKLDESIETGFALEADRNLARSMMRVGSQMSGLMLVN